MCRRSAEEQLLQGGRGRGQGAAAGPVRRRRPRPVGGVDVEGDPVALDQQVVDPGQRRQSVRRPDSSAVTVVRVRWRRSARVPVSTVRPARMMLTRSQSASTSVRMWLESSTVRPRSRSRTHSLEDLLHQRVEARGRLVEDQQLDVGGERGDEGDLLAVALRVGAALLRRVEVEALDQVGRAGAASRPPRSRPSRSMTSPPVRLGHRVTSPGT